MPSIELATILISVSSFLLGVIVGWLTALEIEIEDGEVKRVIAVVLLGAYVISVLAEIQVTDYQTPVLLHTIIGGLVGYLFSHGDGKPFNINIGGR